MDYEEYEGYEDDDGGDDDDEDGGHDGLLVLAISMHREKDLLRDLGARHANKERRQGRLRQAVRDRFRQRCQVRALN